MADFNDGPSSTPTSQKYLDLDGTKYLVDKIKKLLIPTEIDLSDGGLNTITLDTTEYSAQVPNSYSKIPVNNYSNVIFKLNIQNDIETTIVYIKPTSAIKLTDNTYIYTTIHSPYIDSNNKNRIFSIVISIGEGDIVNIFINELSHN